MRLSSHGTWEMIIGGAMLLVLAALLGWFWPPLALLPLPLLIWLVAFFRDPDRPLPADATAVVSPADGTVSDVTEVEFDELLQGPAVRVGIFLSVFNVHVNRAPLQGKVLAITYKKGKFVNAMRHDAASADNESNTIVLGDVATGRPVAVVRQIAGAIARRIVCTVAVGDVVKAGDRIGLIKFGSRTELTLAKHLAPQMSVKVGQKVRGAADVVARLGTPSNAYA